MDSPVFSSSHSSSRAPFADSPVLLVLIASAVLAAVISVFGLVGVVDLYPSSMMSAIKRTGKCTGMLVSRCRQTRATEVMLLRFIQGNGASVVFRAIGAAIPQFDQCELWRIYDVEVPGKCVRRVEALKNYGVKSPFWSCAEVPFET